ncbi:MAG: glycosyltransferase [Candidatus Omnitrophica bacterium]|nr:glycosyltransferase [Candidatus Omnitrophota bacterium]
MSGADQTISFIVPVYNSQDAVTETLQSIAGLASDRPMEIWIVDDGSTDDSVRVIEEWRKNFHSPDDRIRTFLLQIDHGGEAAAMNAGLQKASGAVIAWVESDVKLDPQWLNELLRELEGDNVAGAGGLLLPADDDGSVAKMFGYEIAHKIRSNRGDARHITSANALYRKEVFDRLGLCRVELGESSFDSEFNQRIRSAGLRLRCNPNAIAWHHFKTRLGECLKRTWWYGFRRPFVQSQVLYPFDRILALLVLSTGLLFPALVLLPFHPTPAAGLISIVLIVQIGYSIYLYSKFRDPALLGSFPVFLMRNAMFLIAYVCGWIFKNVAPRSD